MKVKALSCNQLDSSPPLHQKQSEWKKLLLFHAPTRGTLFCEAVAGGGWFAVTEGNGKL